MAEREISDERLAAEALYREIMPLCFEYHQYVMTNVSEEESDKLGDAHQNKVRAFAERLVARRRADDAAQRRAGREDAAAECLRLSAMTYAKADGKPFLLEKSRGYASAADAIRRLP